MKENLSKFDNLESIREYIQKDYWESGQDNKISGYQNSFINWWWVNRWLQCFTSVFTIKDKKILDLGCGYGAMVAGFVTWGADAYGIDISDYAIDKGKKEADFLENRIIQGSIHDLSMYPDASFDMIYSNQVFEHLPEKYVEQLINEMWRVSKPNAKLWLAFVVSTEENGIRKENDPDLTHINIHNMEWWRCRFAKVGFVENIKLNNRIRKSKTGYDKYSFYDYYEWDSIVLEKKIFNISLAGSVKYCLHAISSRAVHILPVSFKKYLKSTTLGAKIHNYLRN
jgi:SAM-dependent methyltransferase